MKKSVPQMLCTNGIVTVILVFKIKRDSHIPSDRKISQNVETLNLSENSRLSVKQYFGES